MCIITRSSREQFVADNPQFAGMSTKAIRESLAAKPVVLNGDWTLPTGAHKAAIREYKAAVEAGIDPKAAVKAPKATDKPRVYKAGGRWYVKVSGVTVNAPTQADALKVLSAILSA